MSDETLVEGSPVAGLGSVAEPGASPPRDGVYVPRWLAGLLVLALALGVGFAVGRVTDDDDHDRRLVVTWPRVGRIPQRDARPALPRVPDLPNVPDVPRVPNPPNRPASAFLGIGIADAPSGTGVVVSGVVAGSPAADAGLRVGDRITRFDGAAVADRAALVTALARHAPGDTVEVVFVRDGNESTVRVRLGSRPASGSTPPTTARPALQLIS